MVTWVFSKLQGLQYYFPENSRCNLKLYESEDFPDSSLHCISESENVRFPFSKKNSLTWGVKLVKVEPAFKNRREFIREASIILHKWKGHLGLFSLTQAIKNSRQFSPPKRYFTENSGWVPLTLMSFSHANDCINYNKLISWPIYGISVVNIGVQKAKYIIF